MFVDVIFVFVNLLRAFFLWIFSFGGSWHSVALSQKEYSSPLLVEQSVLSFFGISLVIFLSEESFYIIISLLIAILLSSMFFFSNNLILEVMFASAKT